MSLTYDCRDCGWHHHRSADGHDTCPECVAKMRARKDETAHIHEKVLRYVLFVLRGSDTVATDLCDEVQMAADETKAEIERLLVALAEAKRVLGHTLETREISALTAAQAKQAGVRLARLRRRARRVPS